MAVKVPSLRNDGTVVTLLNPAEKAAKYAKEMKSRKRLTNEGHKKLNKNGKQKKVSDLGMAYRAGYLQARKDNAKVYNSKKGNTSILEDIPF